MLLLSLTISFPSFSILASMTFGQAPGALPSLNTENVIVTPHQPDNSKCRYTDTRLQEERRRTLVAVDGPLLRHSAFHPSVDKKICQKRLWRIP